MLTKEAIQELRKDLVAECGQSGEMERGIDQLCDLALAGLEAESLTQQLEVEREALAPSTSDAPQAAALDGEV